MGGRPLSLSPAFWCRPATDRPLFWGVGFLTPLGWVGVSCCLKSRERAEESAQAWRQLHGAGRLRAEIRRWRERDGRIRLMAEGQHEIPLSDMDRQSLWDYLEANSRPEPIEEPEPRRLSPELQSHIDWAETQAMCEAEGTPLPILAGDRNPGGRCPECGYSHGHRMNCCFA